MKKIIRRDKLKIYADILFFLYSEGRKDKIILSRLQHCANVPFDRLLSYIDELNGMGLVQQKPRLGITEKGQRYLEEYEKVSEFMKNMGLTY